MPNRCSDAEIQRMLAEDAAIAELGIEVFCNDQAVVLRGDVQSAERRDAIANAVAGHFPGLAVHNDICVLPAHAPTAPEAL